MQLCWPDRRLHHRPRRGTRRCSISSNVVPLWHPQHRVRSEVQHQSQCAASAWYRGCSISSNVVPLWHSQHRLRCGIRRGCKHGMRHHNIYKTPRPSEHHIYQERAHTSPRKHSALIRLTNLSLLPAGFFSRPSKTLPPSYTVFYRSHVFCPSARRL